MRSCTPMQTQTARSQRTPPGCTQIGRLRCVLTASGPLCSVIMRHGAGFAAFLPREQLCIQLHILCRAVQPWPNAISSTVCSRFTGMYGICVLSVHPLLLPSVDLLQLPETRAMLTHFRDLIGPAGATCDMLDLHTKLLAAPTSTGVVPAFGDAWSGAGGSAPGSTLWAAVSTLVIAEMLPQLSRVRRRRSCRIFL